MQKKKLVASLVLSASLICGMIALPTEVNAANTETVYLIQNMTSTGSRTFNNVFSYNSNGMITNIVPQGYEQPFTCQYEKCLLLKQQYALLNNESPKVTAWYY